MGNSYVNYSFFCKHNNNISRSLVSPFAVELDAYESLVLVQSTSLSSEPTTESTSSTESSTESSSTTTQSSTSSSTESSSSTLSSTISSSSTTEETGGASAICGSVIVYILFLFSVAMLNV